MAETGRAAAGILALMVAALAARNAPAILRANIFHPLQRFGELAAESLPAGRGVVLSDQPQNLAVFQAALSRRRNTPDWLAVDTRALPLWPTAPGWNAACPPAG